MADKIDIKIDNTVAQQIFEYAYWANVKQGTEIAGWGHWTKDKGIYKLAPLLKQTASGAEVDTFPEGIFNDVNYDISDMNVQWHSHVNMGCTPSGMSGDKGLIVKALKVFPFLISIIVNCKGEYSCELNISKRGDFDLPEPLQFDCNLIRIYNKESAVRTEVYKKLRLPRPVRSKVIGFTSDNTTLITIKKNGKTYYNQYQDGCKWDNEARTWYMEEDKKAEDLTVRKAYKSNVHTYLAGKETTYGHYTIAGIKIQGQFDAKGEFTPDKAEVQKYNDAVQKETELIEADKKKVMNQKDKTGTVQTGLTNEPLDNGANMSITQLQHLTSQGLYEAKPYYNNILRCLMKIMNDFPMEFEYECDSSTGNIIVRNNAYHFTVEIDTDGTIYDETAKQMAWWQYLERVKLDKDFKYSISALEDVKYT
jgi:hypothetical protein